VIRTGYELQFEPISRENPALGTAALVPWDTEIFGFRVAMYKPGTASADADMARFGAGFVSWMEAHEISLCSCAVAATDSFWRRWLPESGCQFTDFTLQVSLGPLSRAHLPATRLAVRPVMPEDHCAIEAIAGESFAHGRYHADPFFPNELANRRYLRWVQNALSGAKPEDRVFVLGKPGEVSGFYHVTIEGEMSDLRLAAVAPHLKKTGAGVDLYAAMLHELRRLGIRRAVSTISAANSGVLNVYSLLGFRFSKPEIVYHWHAPGGGR
jgi:GNAT superfamily N-acetyltransferase